MYIYIYIYIRTLYEFLYINVATYNFNNLATRHLKLHYISNFTNLLQTGNETKSIKPKWSQINYKR